MIMHIEPTAGPCSLLFCFVRGGSLFLDNQCRCLLESGPMSNHCGTEGSVSGVVSHKVSSQGLET